MPRIRRSAQNGEYYLQDDDGKFIRILNPSEVKAGISEDGFVIPSTAKKAQAAIGKEKVPQLKLEAPLTLGQKAGRLLAGSAPTLGGIVGAEGGPLGITAGSIAGTLAKQGLQGLDPEVYGEGPKTGPDTALDLGLDLGMNVGIPALTNGLINTFITKDPAIRSGLLRFLGKDSMPLEVSETLARHQGIPVSAGQAMDSGIIRGIENITGHRAKDELIGQQQNQLRDIARRKLPLNVSQDFGAEIARNNLSDAFFTLQGNERALWDSVKSDVRANTANITKPVKTTALASAAGLAPKARTETIVGPADPVKSRAFAQKLLKQIKERYGTSEAGALEDRFNAEEKQALNYLKDIANTKGPVAFDALHNIKEFLGDRAFKGQLSNLTSTSSEQGIFKTLGGLIDDDLEAAIQKYPNGTTILKKFKEAKALTKQKYDEFLEHPTTSAFLKTRLSAIPEMKAALGDHKAIEQMIKTSANPAETKAALGGEFLQDILDKGFSKSTKRYVSGSAPFEAFNAREADPIIRSLFTNSQRQEINKLLKTMSYLDPKLPSSGMTSFAYNAAKSGAILAPAVMGALFGEGEMARSGVIAGTVLGGMFGANQFSKRVLMNPRAVRLATDLAKMPPQTQTAKKTARALMLTLKGAQIYLTTPDHEKIVGVGTVGEDGKLKIDSMVGGNE